MKVALTSLWYGFGRGGGAEAVVRRIADGFIAFGHQVVVLTSRDSTSGASTVESIRSERFAIRGRLGYTCFGIVGDVESFFRLIEMERFDCILVYAAQTWACDLLLRAAEMGRTLPPLVLIACGFSGLVGHRRPFYINYFRRMRRLIHFADAVVCHDGHYIDFQFCKSHGVNPQIIPNGVDSLFQRSTRFRDANGLHGKRLVVCVSNHLKNKGHAEFLDIVLGGSRSDTVGVIVGGDVTSKWRSCWKRCREISSKSAGRILLTGPLSAIGVQEVLGSADVFLFTSKVEASPLVLIEAMAAGVPFVSTDVGNARSLKGGVVCDSSKEIRHFVERILGDPDYSDGLAALGRAQVQENFLWSHIQRQYVELVEALVMHDKKR